METICAKTSFLQVKNHISRLSHYNGAALAEAASALARRAPLVTMMQLKSGTQGTRFNGSKAEKELGFTYTAMELGLEKTVTWYKEQGLLKK